MARRPLRGQDCTMTIQAHMKQRDLVRLAVLMCGDRPGAKYTRPAKGVHDSRNLSPASGFLR
jgi:hypothetical protein